MNVVSFFDGMGCLFVALNDLGIKIDNYYSYEIDKYANQVSKALNPNQISKGDVRFFDINDYKERIDIFAGGSPCTDLSFAGKRSGLICDSLPEYLELREEYLLTKNEDLFFHNGKFQQSILFWEWLRALKEIQKVNPNVIFLLENVIMGKQYENRISRELGIAPIRINARLVSGQNRDRLFWCNIKTEKFGLFDDLHCTIPQPKDRGILLKDVLETWETSNFKTKEHFDKHMSKYFLSEKSINSLMKWEKRNKEYGNGFKANIKDEFDKSSTIPTGSMKSSSTFIKIDKKGKIKGDQEKASCFTAGGHSGGNHSDMDLIVHNTMPRSSTTGKGGSGHLSKTDGKSYCLDTGGKTNAIEFTCVAMRGRSPDNTKSRESGLITEQQLESRTDGKTNCLTSVSKDNLVMETEIKSNIRRLTPREVCRLQSIPEASIDVMLSCGVSSSQVYRMVGNGWNIEVIKHILSYLDIKKPD